MRAQNAWGEDEALDEQHSALGRGAARFLSLREFDDAETCFAALKALYRSAPFPTHVLVLCVEPAAPSAS